MSRDPGHGSISEICPHYEAAFRLLGRRWTGLIVTALMEGPRRFSEISEAVFGLRDRMLSQRLSELEDAALIERRVDAGRHPVLIEYGVTEQGRELRPAFEALQSWAEKWVPVAGVEAFEE